MKRTVFLGVALFALMAVGVFAQTKLKLSDVDITRIEERVLITKYKGSATNIEIPAMFSPTNIIGGIGDGAFKNANITAVTFEEGGDIKTIGKSAFEGCTSLTSVKGIPEVLTVLEAAAFKGCTKLAEVTFENRYGTQLTTIRDEAFRNCYSLASITLPAKVTTIGAWAFGDTGLTSVTIPNGVTRLEPHAFVNSTKLTSVYIPASVTFIGGRAFYNSPNLRSVIFAGSIPSSGFDGIAFETVGDIRDKYLAAAGGAGTYTSTGSGNNRVWTKITSAAAAPAATGTPRLVYTLTADGKGYRVQANDLLLINDVVIPASYNNLPVTEIASAGFDGNPMMKSVTIPASVNSIGSVAFMKCGSLTSVTFQGNNTRVTSLIFPGDLDQKYLAGKAGTYTRPTNGTTWTKK